MLLAVNSHNSLSFRSPHRRLAIAALLACVAISLSAAGCRSASSLATRLSQKNTDDARQQLDAIPPPVKTRYLAVRSLSVWANPYLTVQGEMVTLHVTLADSNPTALGRAVCCGRWARASRPLTLILDRFPRR